MDRVRMDVTVHQKKNENKGKRERQEKRWQSISKEVRAALLRPFRGQHGEKIIG